MYNASGVRSGDQVGSILVVQWNIDHLLAKGHELEGWLREHHIDVPMMQQSKLRTKDGAVCVMGYSVVRRGMLGRNRGGSFCLLVRSDWSFFEVESTVPVESGL